MRAAVPFWARKDGGWDAVYGKPNEAAIRESQRKLRMAKRLADQVEDELEEVA